MPRGFRGGARRTIALERLIARDGDHCWYCGGQFVPGKRSRTIDHVVPLALRGRNRLDNLRLACARCNHAKGSLTGAAYAASPDLALRSFAILTGVDLESRWKEPMRARRAEDLEHHTIEHESRLSEVERLHRRSVLALVSFTTASPSGLSDAGSCRAQ
jgi:HNH endonuclease